MTEVKYNSPSLLVNQNNYEKNKNKLTCMICNNIPIDPVQCFTCSYPYCRKCIGEQNCIQCNKKTPIEPSKDLTDLINELQFKCVNNCGVVLNYSDIESHYKSHNNKDEYNTLLKKYITLIRLIEAKSFTKETNFKGKKITSHPHGLVKLTTEKNEWKCQKCQHVYRLGTPCFYCTLCDYEICENCISN